MAEIIKTTFKLRRGNLEVWERNNPVLAKGEPGFIIDKNTLKIGDGVTPWKELKYIGIGQDDLAKAIEDYFKENPGAGGGFVARPEPPEDTSILWIDTDDDYEEESQNVDLTGYATEEYVQNKIAEAQLEGEDIDLSGYAKTADLPEKLPNPNRLTLTGAVEAVYDGSEAITVEIPQGGTVTDEQAAQIQANKEDIEILVNDKLWSYGWGSNVYLGTDDGGNVVEKEVPEGSGSVTDEQIASAVEDYMAEHPVIPAVTIEPAEDDIPKVFFGGALQQTKDEAVVPFRYISKTDDFSGYAEIKAQGNSSMNYAKKNQTVKLFKDADCTEKLKVDFKGWGKQNKHVYKANWIDLTHARNVVSARLWADVVKSRANYADLPELLRTAPNQGAVDGFPIKVYAAGVYQGRYTMNIPKDAWAFNMDDKLDNHCVLCGENYVSGCFRAAANINESDWTDEIHKTVPESIKTRWNQVISFVMNSTDEEFKANLNQFFYVDSLIDYYLFGLASCGLDAFGKNQIYATYDGQRWIASMYDMDSTWGLWWTGANFVATDYDRTEFQDFKDGNGNLLYIRLEELFFEEIQARWEELKNVVLSIENVINRFERFTDIAPAELVEEDYAKTTGGGKFTGIPSQSTNNIQQIRSFALARLAWTDSYVSALTGGTTPSDPEPSDIPCTGITLNKSALTFTANETQTITATVTPVGCTDAITWESNNTSVATVNGGVVTAVGNGDATITARCGNYSATCSVEASIIGEVDDGVDYTLNPLAGVNWMSGQAYDNQTGAVKASTTDTGTEKFSLQNCAYILHPATHDWARIMIWNEADEYVGCIGNSAQKDDIFFVAKSGYKYALSVYGASIDSDLTFMPKKNTTTGVTSFEVDVSNITITDGNSAVDIAGSELLPGVTNYADEIANSNYFIFYARMATGSNYRGNGQVIEKKEPLLCLAWFNNGTGNLCTKFFGTDANAAKTWFAEHGNLIVNEGY